MHESVIGAEVKIARAHAHFETVEREITRVVGNNAYTTPSEHDAECTEYRFTIEGLKPLRGDLSAIVGDLLHNLRSALDHLAHGLIDAAGSRPTPSTMFPIL